MTAATKPLAPIAKKTTKKAQPTVLTPASAVSKASLIPVFVYGSLKRKFQLHDHYLKGQEFIGRALITGYTIISLGSFPGLIKTGNPEHQVLGEFYLCSEEAYHAMRSMEERAGYETVTVEGKFCLTNAVPTLTDSSFKAQAWVLPTEEGVAEWSLYDHGGQFYGFVANTPQEKKE